MLAGFQKTAKKTVRQALGPVTAALFIRVPLNSWPAFVGRIHGIKTPKGTVRRSVPEPLGGANINILLELLRRTAHLQGAVAECGVFQGDSLIPMAIYLRQAGSTKAVYGFDSFEGFGDTIDEDNKLAHTELHPDAHRLGYSDTALDLVERKVKAFSLSNVRLIRGYFQTSLQLCRETAFSYVHLDCDTYTAYRDCLNYFYPRMADNGIISLDEYDDPPWPGCNKAVDEFLVEHPETLQQICLDNHIKYYFVKSPKSTF
jgi:hypothetical protein